MSDIKLVIKIPKAYYELVLERCKDPVLLNAFKNGTPLPKGHGRLIDADALNLYNISPSLNEELSVFGVTAEDVDLAPTIIEADRSEKE